MNLRFVLSVVVIFTSACDPTSQTTEPNAIEATESIGGRDEEIASDAEENMPATRAVFLAQQAGEASVEDCPNGGIVLDYGVDVNGNGLLESDEVDGSEVVCHGRNGTDGTDGDNGQMGLPGIMGLQGADGAQGQPGSRGDAGPSGPQGAPGVAGPQGEPGDDGRDGRDGRDADSCILLDNHDRTYTIFCPGSAPLIIQDAENCTTQVDEQGNWVLVCPGSAPITIRDGDPCLSQANPDGSHTIICPDGPAITIPAPPGCRIFQDGDSEIIFAQCGDGAPIPLTEPNDDSDSAQHVSIGGHEHDSDPVARGGHTAHSVSNDDDIAGHGGGEPTTHNNGQPLPGGHSPVGGESHSLDGAGGADGGNDVQSLDGGGAGGHHDALGAATAGRDEQGGEHMSESGGALVGGHAGAHSAENGGGHRAQTVGGNDVLNTQEMAGDAGGDIHSGGQALSGGEAPPSGGQVGGAGGGD